MNEANMAIASCAYRDAQLRTAEVEGRKTLRASFSSELPVYRYGYVGGELREFYEILDHSDGSVIYNKERGVPLLLNHITRDLVGKVINPKVANKEFEGEMQFSRSETGQDVRNDVEDGIRDTVSIGYQVERYREEGTHEGLALLRATKWRLRECTLTPIPADETVGLKRDQSNTTNAILETRMKITKPLLEALPSGGGGSAPAPTVNVEEIRSQAQRMHQENTKEILAISKKVEDKHPEIRDLRDRALAGEIDLATFRTKAFELVTNAKPIDLAREQNIGMSEKDIAKYSFHRAITCAANGKLDGLEGECHNEAIKRYQLTPRGSTSIIVPFDVLNYSKRDQLVGTGTLGGNIVATNLLASSFIDILRNRMLVARMGAQMLSGLVGNVAIPRQSGAASAFWAASEAAATTESSVTFDQVTMTPKQVTGRVDYSWLLLNQGTPSVDGLVRNDLQNVIARAIDLAALHGTGSSGQPTGIAATSGIGSVAGGTNGAAPTWANIVSLETEVAIDNADMGTLGYLTNARVRGKLKTTLKGGTTATDGIYIWPGVSNPDGFGELNGYRAGVSNQVSNTLTKGTSTTVCSAIFFGNWADLLIGMWSGLELLTNPYTQAANRIVEVYAYQALDVAVRHPESFSAMLDALTT